MSSSTWWYSAGWIDGERQVLVVQSKTEGDSLLRVVDLKSGDVRSGTTEDLLRVLKQPKNPEGRAHSLEILLKTAPEKAKADALRIFEEDCTPDEKVRAGALLATCEDFRAKPLYRSLLDSAKSHKERSDAVDAVKFAIRHCALVLREEAETRLRDLMVGKAGPYWHSCQLGFVGCGEEAVDTLLEMAQDLKGTPDYRGGACYALKAIGQLNDSPRVAQALVVLAGDESEYVANAALNSAIELGGESVSDALLGLLERGSTQDGRIGMYFQKHRHPRAAEVIARVIEDESRGCKGFAKRALQEALAFQAQVW